MPARNIGAVTLFVEDLAASKMFYQTVFGAPVIFEDENSAVLAFENTVINLLDVSAAPELIEPAEVAGPKAGSRFQFSIFVDDVDAECAELGKHEVTLINGPMDRPWGMRTACFADPSGHIWEYAQELS
jgi:catechol 2,3-dioxygenase-like lactoylglutathione lyase family enzyme